MGPDRARAAARGLSLQTAGSLVVIGFCGGLDADSVPGEVIVADEVYAATDEGHAEGASGCALRDELVRASRPGPEGALRAHRVRLAPGSR